MREEAETDQEAQEGSGEVKLLVIVLAVFAFVVLYWYFRPTLEWGWAP